MRDFCASSSLLPTRADLVEKGIEFAVRPSSSPVFVGQASTVKAQDSSQVASPNAPARRGGPTGRRYDYYPPMNMPDMPLGGDMALGPSGVSVGE